MIFLDNIESLRYLFKKLYPVANMDLSHTVLFISSLTTLNLNTISEVFRAFYYMSILKVSLVIELAEDDIIMVTYFPFTETSCNDFKPVIINRYLVKEERWSSLEYFPIKSKNFYGCPFTCCIWEDMPYFKVTPDKEVSNNVDDIGIEAELLNFLAFKLNFTIKIYEMIGHKEDVNNKAKIFNQIFSQHCDFALGGFTYKKDLDNTSSYSQTDFYLLSPIYIVTNVIKPYTTYEKLAFPFKNTVWLMLGLIFALSSLLICSCGLRRQWLQYRDFLIGSANKTPHFHLYVVALGANMSWIQVPKRNFARFLLTSWLMGTLILRCAYQSGMYQMLRDNKQWNPPQTIENVFKQNYLISMTPENRRYLTILPDVRHYRIFNNTILEAFWQLLVENEPIAFVTPYEYFGYFAKISGARWQHLHLVNERLLTQQLTIYVRHNSYLIPEINRQILKAQFYGYITLWSRQYSLSGQQISKPSTFGPLKIDKYSEIPLSLKELGAIFLILVWLHLLSIGVFVVELLWNRYG